jgi:hypothetical protein
LEIVKPFVSVAIAGPAVTVTLRAPVAASGSTKIVAVSVVAFTYVVCTVTPEPLNPTTVEFVKPEPVTVAVVVVPMSPVVVLSPVMATVGTVGENVAIPDVAPVVAAVIVADESEAPL